MMTLARAERLQRWRLIVLVGAMFVLLRLPRVEWIAQQMFQRWHVKRSPFDRAASRAAV